MSLAKWNPANAVSFDSILPGEAEPLKGTPITVTSPRKAKLVSQCKPASLPYFILHISWGELSEHGATCVSACMNENVCVKSASEARSNFSFMSERLLTETEGCWGGESDSCPLISARRKDGWWERGEVAREDQTQTCKKVDISVFQLLLKIFLNGCWGQEYLSNNRWLLETASPCMNILKLWKQYANSLIIQPTEF